MTSLFESKNELLRAVDSRLSELKEQLADALNKAIGASCSPKDISELENFAHHFGAEDIRDSLQKFLELSQFSSSKVSPSEKRLFAPRPSQLNPPVRYGFSPAKAAQIERQSSTDSGNSFSSEEDQPSAERSRTIARSAMPRRSASPMRQVQIGRTGPPRSAAISIKSLNYYPSRDKAPTQRDATGHSSEDEEDSQTPAKKNALRMTNKAVLRRWSSGMSESANETSSRIARKDDAPGVTPESCTKISTSQTYDTVENVELSLPKKGTVDILNLENVYPDDERDAGYEKHPASIEWNQQKEAELNQLFKKMMESKPVRRHSVTNDNSKSKSQPKVQRGGDEKLRKEASGKKAEKESQSKEMEKFLDERKAEMTSTNTIRKLASVVKKTTTTTKPSLPATRKSWPSTPTPRPTGASPAKTSSGPISSSANLTRKSQSAIPAVRSSTKVEKPQSRSKTLKATQPDAKTSLKTVTEKKQPTVTKSAQAAKPKSRTKADSSIATATTTTATAKPSFYNKVTKKNSVVPLETKPFLRKGTGIVPPKAVVRSKVVAQPAEQPLSTPDMIQAETLQEVETETIEIPCQVPETKCEPPESNTQIDLKTHAVTPIKCEERESSDHNQVDVSGDNGFKTIEMADNNIVIDNESTISISPTAWVEVDEHHQDEIIPCREVAGPANRDAATGVSSPRVRHSLFQMLLEETSEPDSSHQAFSGEDDAEESED
nr:hypothetical protein [Tanacetum cinerariifolium]